MDTLLIVGLGDIARRALSRLRAQFEIVALVRVGSAASSSSSAGLRTVIPGDLDDPASLRDLAGCATHVLYTAPPPNAGREDPRTRNLLEALGAGTRTPARIVYISTSGVYGDCAGAWVDEARPVRPHTDRARRRVDAETQLQAFGRRHDVRIVILRAPGIYAADRLPLRRLHNRTPVLCADDDVYTNHIHADDLATMCAVALTHPNAAGIYNACDDQAMYMGAWFDLLAERASLPRAPRIARSEAAEAIPAPLLSFMSESRRLSNERIKRELGLVLRYPSVYDGVPPHLDVPNA